MFQALFVVLKSVSEFQLSVLFQVDLAEDRDPVVRRIAVGFLQDAPEKQLRFHLPHVVPRLHDVDSEVSCIGVR